MHDLTGLSMRVGPHGYIHGWIFVGAPGLGDHVFHPHHGHGTVTGVSPNSATVKFASGARSFPRGHDRGPAQLSGPALLSHSASQHGLTASPLGSGPNAEHAIMSAPDRNGITTQVLRVSADGRIHATNGEEVQPGQVDAYLAAYKKHPRWQPGALLDSIHGRAAVVDEWAAQWTAAWEASAERFNKMHGAPGSGKGGQFVSSSSGGGTKTKTTATHTGKTTTAKTAHTAKAPHNVPHHPVSGPAAPGGIHAARKRQITAKIHADEAKITTLEHELHQQEKAMHAAAAQAAHAKAQHAKSAKAGHHKAAAHHKASHKHHHRKHLSHRQRITQIHAELHKLRTEVKGLRAQAAKL